MELKDNAAGKDEKCPKCKGRGWVTDAGLQIVYAMLNKPLPKLCVYPCPTCQPEVFAKVSQEYADLRRQVAALQAIVDKLPKTKDGVPAVPGDVVYHDNGGGYIEAGLVALDADGAWIVSPNHTLKIWNVCDCYSTREALPTGQTGAEEAKK